MDCVLGGAFKLQNLNYKTNSSNFYFWWCCKMQIANCTLYLFQLIELHCFTSTFCLNWAYIDLHHVDPWNAGEKGKSTSEKGCCRGWKGEGIRQRERQERYGCNRYAQIVYVFPGFPFFSLLKKIYIKFLLNLLTFWITIVLMFGFLMLVYKYVIL